MVGRYSLLGAAILIVGLVAASLLSRGEGHSENQDVMVFAAASLGDVMHEVGAAFALNNETPHRVRFNVAASNVLAQQILASSQADIFLSANERWMDRVEEAGRLIAGSRRIVLSNRLVIIAHDQTNWEISEPADLVAIPFRHLFLANPEAVPAGIYAKAFLESIGYHGEPLWAALSPRVAPALDVRAALAMVEVDPSVVGIVYYTDAKASARVRTLFEIPQGGVWSINYLAARVYRASAPAAAAEFYDFLFSDEVGRIFTQHGFVPAGNRG